MADARTAPTVPGAARAPLVPVTVVTGFLGAGKTTVVNALLAAAGGDGRTVVVCNEAGTTSVRDEVGGPAVELVEVLGGCACCTLNLELVVRLAGLARRLDGVARVILETSGVADPVPVLQAFQHADVRRAMRVLGVLAVVDPCGTGEAADPWLWRRQVGIADRVVVSRADVAAPARLAAVDARLDAVAAPGAERRRAARGAVDPAWALGAPPAVAPVPRAPTGPRHGHDHGDGPHGHHAEYAEVALVPPARVDPDALAAWLAAVGTRADAPVLRAKGTVLLGDGRRVALQGVDGRLELRPTGRPGPDRLGVLGAGLDRDELRRGLAACAAR